MSPKTFPKEVLRRAFPGIKPDEADEMVASGMICTYPANMVLCHEGAAETTFYIILDGEVEVTKVIGEDQNRILKHLFRGDFFGEMALIHDAPRAATVTTVSQVAVLEIRKEHFTELLQKSSSVSLAMVREVSRRLRENDEMAIEDLRIKAHELAIAYEQLAEMDYARREFLTTIAHEMRTPLTAAGGFLQFIRRGVLQGEALNSAMDTIALNIQEIISLTNNILFLQEMDLILPEFERVDIGIVVAACVEQLRARAEHNQVGFGLNIAPGLPKVYGDQKSLKMAFSAILDNAVKFSPEGGIVQVDVGHHDEDVWIRMSDHGVGIPKEAMPRIFERFFRLEEVGGHMFRGLGLGLPIARQVIEQHGGAIEVESEIGQGSMFTVWLKAGRVDQLAEQVADF